MRTLIVMRHAKSDWSSGTGSDIDRELATRGYKAARLMGRFITTAGCAPDLVVTSPAVRARTTAELALSAGEWGCPLEVNDTFYGGGAQAILSEIGGFPEHAATILMASHEPTCSTLTSHFLGQVSTNFVTAAAACITFAGDDWSMVPESRGTLLWFVPPRSLK